MVDRTNSRVEWCALGRSADRAHLLAVVQEPLQLVALNQIPLGSSVAGVWQEG